LIVMLCAALVVSPSLAVTLMVNVPADELGHENSPVIEPKVAPLGSPVAA
jgi:hypothetical protein